MRIRQWLAAAGIVTLVAFGVAGTAHAQEGEGETETEADISHAAEECIHILEDGGEVDDCQEAPSPILPETNEIIWGSLAFLVLLVGMWKWGIPAVRNMSQARTERIQGDLEAAEQAKVAAENTRREYEAQLADARAEAGRIIDEAREAGERVREERIGAATTEANEIRAQAQADIDLMRDRAMAELRNDVATMSIDLAERIVERNLDRPTQMQLVESFIDQVGRSN